MEITFEPINGITVGGEYIQADDPAEEFNTFLIDIFIFRIIIQW